MEETDSIIKKTIYRTRMIYKIIKNVKNWNQFLYKHLTKSKDAMIINTRDGYKLKIRPCNTEMSMFIEIWIDKCYNQHGFKIRDSDIVIDIGGNIGMFSAYAAKENVSGKIYAFEPIKENYEIFKENILLNNMQSNVNVNNVAVAKVAGKVEMNIFDAGNSGTSSLYNKDNKESRKTEVEAINLENFILVNNIKRIDFLKVDCEGAEYEIILNLPKEVLNIIDKMVIESHLNTEHDEIDLIYFLSINGFDIKSQKEHIIYAERKQNEKI